MQKNSKIEIKTEKQKKSKSVERSKIKLKNSFCDVNWREELESKIAQTYGLDLLKKLKEWMN